MLAIIGLGNPDSYKNTWHNIGKHFCEYLITSQQFNCILHKTYKGLANIYKCKLISQEKNRFNYSILIIIPTQIYMNTIGNKLLPIIKQLPISTLIVAHDDLSFPLGQTKLTPKPNKNHNGIIPFLGYNKLFNTLFLRLGTYQNTQETNHIPRKQLVLKKIPEQSLTQIYDMFKASLENLIIPVILKPDLAKQGYSQRSE